MNDRAEHAKWNREQPKNWQEKKQQQRQWPTDHEENGPKEERDDEFHERTAEVVSIKHHSVSRVTESSNRFAQPELIHNSPAENGRKTAVNAFLVDNGEQRKFLNLSARPRIFGN